MSTVQQGDKINLDIPQGETYQHTIHWRDSAGSTIDLTGYSVRMQFREQIDDTDTLYDSVTEGGVTLDEPNGDILIAIPASITEAWEFRNAVYDLEIENGSGVVTRVMKGRVRVDPEVTR